MTWESFDAIGSGQMPDDQEWILFCHQLAKTYLLFTCGSPPDGCELGTFWQDHDLGSYPSFGLYCEYSTSDSDQYLSACSKAIEMFHSAIDWDKINPDFKNEEEDFQLNDLDEDELDFEEDQFAFHLGINVAELFILHPDIDKRKTTALQSAIVALRALPIFTQDFRCTFRVNHKVGDDNFGEVRFIEFEISELNYQIRTGNNVYAHSNLVDSNSEICFFVGSDTLHSEYYDLSRIEQTVLEYLQQGAEVVV